ELFEKLEAAGVKTDFREPNVIRVAPAPLYNTFDEVWRFAQILCGHH
ncbi:MAG: kynureninase, partial [Verrucomicrobiota bacterium]|nr:kynureninase [Verrucomicrobiota bacterium]